MIIVLSGGVGGAKLVVGMSHVLPPEELLVIANTGDDFEYLGLSISPDIDTIIYALADLANAETGWGRKDETWSFMETVEKLGGDPWFRLRDRDLAVHTERTRRLRSGDLLSEITRDFGQRFGLRNRILPMSDNPIRTKILTDEGRLEFQDYFVRRQCGPKVRGLEFHGSDIAFAHPEFLKALSQDDLRGVVICPSNPLISIGPILSIAAVRSSLLKCVAPVVAVSPVVAGRAFKGPTTKMMRDLGLDPSASTIARYYRPVLDGFIVDPADLPEIASIDVYVTSGGISLTTLDEKIAAAHLVLDTIEFLREKS